MKNNNYCFTITTDFGLDFASSHIEGVLLKENIGNKVVRITDQTKPFDLQHARFIIEQNYQYFPDKSIHICVIDPGVGTNRKVLAINTGETWFVGPDNGIFYYLAKINSSLIYRYNGDIRNISNTFHGRDLFTKIALQINKGSLADFEKINIDEIVRIDDFKKGQILHIDPYGNYKINLKNLPKKNRVDVVIKEKSYQVKVVNTFGEANNGDAVVYIGSNDLVELAMVGGNALSKVGAEIGELVQII